MQGEFQELRKRYLRQHLWARGYFIATSRQITTNDI
ncbi:MAG: hypothetical protein IJ599_00420 [Alphaproteobacteria bacterium]|nr:hypothetical protein [Alphaproteobacteria bacterium]